VFFACNKKENNNHDDDKSRNLNPPPKHKTPNIKLPGIIKPPPWLFETLPEYKVLPTPENRVMLA